MDIFCNHCSTVQNGQRLKPRITVLCTEGVKDPENYRITGQEVYSGKYDNQVLTKNLACKRNRTQILVTFDKKEAEPHEKADIAHNRGQISTQHA